MIGFGGTEITWKCDICKQIRPDHLISVHSKELVIRGEVMEHATEHINHCNDNPECIAAAPNYSHLKQKGDGGTDA